MEGARDTHIRGVARTPVRGLAVADLDAPPAEQARVDGPGAWPKQRKRSGERCE